MFTNADIFYLTIIVGIIGAFGNACQIKALKLGELSTLVPINSYKIIFSLIFSYFLLGEIPSLKAFLGIILIISGTYLLFSNEKGNLLKRKDIRYRILAVLFTALEAIFIKKIILLSNCETALFLWALASALFSLIFTKKFNKPSPKSATTFVLLALSMGIMQFSTNILFKMMNVSYALSLFQLSSILSVILGYKIFKEKDIIKKLIAASIMVSGAVLIMI